MLSPLQLDGRWQEQILCSFSSPTSNFICYKYASLICIISPDDSLWMRERLPVFLWDPWFRQDPEYPGTHRDDSGYQTIRSWITLSRGASSISMLLSCVFSSLCHSFGNLSQSNLSTSQHNVRALTAHVCVSQSNKSGRNCHYADIKRILMDINSICGLWSFWLIYHYVKRVKHAFTARHLQWKSSVQEQKHTEIFSKNALHLSHSIFTTSFCGRTSFIELIQFQLKNIKCILVTKTIKSISVNWNKSWNIL